MKRTVRFSENSLIALRKKLNEIMVGSDDIVSHNDVSAVKLYHGTTIDALLIIMESGVMSAKCGRQHGETYGVNWFSLKDDDNFNRGTLFSIEVPGDAFNERFRMMNSSEAVSKDDDLDVTSFNLTIEKICGLSREAIKRAYDRYVNSGDRYPLESTGYLFDHFIERVQDDDVLFPSILYHNWDKYYPMIMKNILGNDVVNENKHPKELDDNISNEFAPVTEIGSEPNSPMGGTYYHQKQTNESIDFNKNGLSINDDKMLDKYNLKDLILSKNGNYVTLNKIVANEFGKGNGSRFMEELTKMADENGWILALTPDTSFGGTSVGRLKNFYKRFGFKPNNGRNSDFNTRESMVRKPNKSKNVIIPENKLGVIKENIEPEVASSEVDLSSFKKRDTLPPGIWKDEDTLDSRVRLKLLDIADDFWEFVNLSWVEPKSVIITGSICNFNWSKFSDIDLHIVVDFSEVDSKTEFVKQYLDSKKNEWNTEHEGLKIMGFPVELYVQDINDDIEAGGIYDLEENKWVRKPNPHAIKSIGLNKFNIKDKSAEIMTIIDDMYDKLSSTDDGYEIDKIGEDAHYLWDKVKDLRKKSLNKNGESGSGNIVYKVLRRTGYLDKLFKLFSRVYDRSNSITEGRLELITESQESKSVREAKRLLMDRGQSEEDADYIVRTALRNDIPAFEHNPSVGKFTLGVVRMWLNRQITDAATILRLDDTLRIASTDEYTNQFDRNLNGISAQEFINMFAPIIEEIHRQYREQVNSTVYKQNNRYTIVPINSYRQATEYNRYNDWCLSRRDELGRNSYETYTCDGLCQLYFCLRDDYKEMTNRKEIGEGCPLDDYGLSMIAVVVNEKGNLRVCTTRWNHENGGTDKAMNPVEISQLIGRNFYEVFKPHSELTESVKKYLTLLKEEVALDGSSEDNPYKDRWKAERDALKSFVATYGKLMQSREDNKGGKLYKVYFDETMSNLIGYNYCICVQWDEQEMKPGSTVYIRALDKFTPFIRRDLQFDTRGRDNKIETDF